MIVVLGATGNIGSLLVPKLVQKGVKVRAVTRDPSKAERIAASGVEVVKGGLDDAASLTPAMQGAEKLFLLSTPSPSLFEWEKAAIDAAKAAGVKHIVKVSAIGADVQSPVVVGAQHARSEQYLKESGVPFTIVQPQFFLQNLFLNLPTIKADGSVYNANGDGRFAPVDADDVAAVVAEVLTSAGHEGKQYLITGPEAVTFADICKELGAAAGREIKHVSIPEAAYAGALEGAGLPSWLAVDLAKLSAIFATGVASGVSPDAEKLLGRKPRSVQEWAKQNGPAFA